MTAPNVLNPHPPEFERFLYASVGEDQNGYAVTMLSTLARLGLDPWKESAELVMLGRDAAQSRLRTLLARFRGVPALASDHARVARDLSRLLPEDRKSSALKQTASTVVDSGIGTNGALWTVFAIMFLLFQIFVAGGSGSGE